jgi:hypothetical protein
LNRIWFPFLLIALTPLGKRIIIRVQEAAQNLEIKLMAGICSAKA